MDNENALKHQSNKLKYPDNKFGIEFDLLNINLPLMKTRASIMMVLIILILVINSCKKEQVIEPAQDITGQWIWIFSYTGGNPSIQPNPLTPQNTGIQEIIKFNSNNTWLKIQNNIPIDSGTYKTGHGSYLPYIGAYNFIYDSIVYFRNGISEKETQDYYKIFKDTLQFSSGYAGICGGGSKFFIKQK